MRKKKIKIQTIICNVMFCCWFMVCFFVFFSDIIIKAINIILGLFGLGKIL